MNTCLSVVVLVVGVAIAVYVFYAGGKKYEREENIKFSVWDLARLYPNQKSSNWAHLRSRTLQAAEGEEGHSFFPVVFAWHEDDRRSNTEKECRCLANLYMNFMSWALNAGVPMEIHNLEKARFSHTDGEGDIKAKLSKLIEQNPKRETTLWYISDARHFPNVAFLPMHQFMNGSSHILISILDVGDTTNSEDASLEFQNLFPSWITEEERAAIVHNIFVFVVRPEWTSLWKVKCEENFFKIPIHRPSEYRWQ